MKFIFLLLLFCYFSFISCDITRTEVIVVGSGFGGSVTSYRLANEGINVILLEKGRRWEIGDSYLTGKDNVFSPTKNPDGRAIFMRNSTFMEGNFPSSIVDVSTGAFTLIDSEVNELDPDIRIRTNNDLRIISGTGVGGGSLVYNGATIRPNYKNFHRVWTQVYDDDEYIQELYNDLDEIYFPRALNVMKPEKIPDSILNTDYYKHARAFRDDAINALSDKGSIRKLDIMVDWKAVQEEIDGIRKPSAIIGDVAYGSNSGYKKSLDKEGNYLFEAEKTGKVDIKTFHSVHRVQFDEDNDEYVLSVHELNESGDIIDEHTFISKHLFLCMGSHKSTSLLVRSKAINDLPNLDNNVGKYFNGNGDTIFIRTTGEENINPGQGAPCDFIYRETINGEECAFEAAPFYLLENIGLTNGYIVVGLGNHKGFNEFEYDEENDEVIINWDISTVEDTYNNMVEINERLNAHNPGSSYMMEPIEIASGTTAHPLGGLVIGKATDNYGRVKGYKNLYVIDGSLIPGGTGISNPSLSIAALAERCIENIIKNDFNHDQNNSDHIQKEKLNTNDIIV
eukprot:TRINITY_DN10963_c0_g1_i1.p1 TRINITY_DN10963_c0_g1~~TRINITY_DN10963_c0_g1_i1.p1  ORF type:complete len:566 (-),score=214.91 TRINITY_DN10963_c0_g1_i1:2-1699(-)